MSPVLRRGRLAPALVLACVLPLALSCMHAGGQPADVRQAAPAVDSATVALWHFDETTGIRCLDAGPSRIEATAGYGTRVSFGRFGSAREFARAIDSFVYAPNDPAFDPRGGLTVEAWVLVHAFGRYEDTPIAARWNVQENQLSWLFGVVGRNLQPPNVPVSSLGYHATLVGVGSSGQLVFAFQPQDASQPRGFLSVGRLQLERWTHVAASYDGSVVRLFIDGRLDAQYAIRGRIQTSEAALLVGNYFDTTRLSTFSGELRLDAAADQTPYYAFEGLIDELRISDEARSVFPGTGVR